MKKIVFGLAIIFSISVSFTSCKFEKKSEEKKVKKMDANEIVDKEVYQCPMKCEKEKKYDEEGNCPVCKMKLLKTKGDIKERIVENNPVVYFEIPVKDIDRAIKFYKSVFNFSFEREIIDKNEMALFPFIEAGSGISGALAKGEVYKPTNNGVIIYFKTESIDKALKAAIESGGKILYPKTSNGDLGFVAEFEDSEGNRIALHQSLK